MRKSKKGYYIMDYRNCKECGVRFWPVKNQQYCEACRKARAPRRMTEEQKSREKSERLLRAWRLKNGPGYMSIVERQAIQDEAAKVRLARREPQFAAELAELKAMFQEQKS